MGTNQEIPRMDARALVGSFFLRQINSSQYNCFDKDYGLNLFVIRTDDGQWRVVNPDRGSTMIRGGDFILDRFLSREDESKYIWESFEEAVNQLNRYLNEII